MVKFEIDSTDKEEIALVHRYWAMNEDGAFTEKAADLLPFRHINGAAQLTAFLATISHAWDTNQVCPKCQGFEPVESRGAVKKTPRVMRYQCTPCSLSAHTQERIIQTQAEAEVQRRLIPYAKKVTTHSVDYTLLPDDVALLLLALDRAINPRLLSGSFREGDCGALAPGDTAVFIKRLQTTEAILEDPRLTKSGTYFLRDDKLWCLNAQLVYVLAPDSTHGKNEDAFAILSERPFDDGKSLKNLWLDYAVADCVRYLVGQCELHSLQMEEVQQDEARSCLRFALLTYSVAELWSVAWLVVRDAASLSARPYYSHAKAAATIPGKLARFLEKVAKGAAKVTCWRRHAHHPAGAIGQLFHELFGIDENTTGTEVVQLFDSQKNASASDPFEKELAPAARVLLSNALAHDLAGEVMVYFADAIRSGSDIASAIEETYEYFEAFKEPT